MADFSEKIVESLSRREPSSGGRSRVFVVAVPDLIALYLMAPAVRWKLVGLKPTYRTRLALYLMALAVRWKLEPYRP